MARRNLEGTWGISVGVALVAALLGGLIAGTGSNINFNFNEDTVRNLPPIFWTVLVTVFVAVALLGRHVSLSISPTLA